MDAATAFALAAAVHAGFQLTVTVLVYPALAAVPAEQWTAAHSAHSRRITPLVGVAYAALVLTGGWYVVAGPDVVGCVALLLAGLALVVTAASSAPLHGRLASDDARLSTRMPQLLRVDRLRCAAALAAAAAAVTTLR